jgi:hypothetical protein
MVTDAGDPLIALWLFDSKATELPPIEIIPFPDFLAEKETVPKVVAEENPLG